MALSKVVRPLRGGQITIPAEFRSKLRIDERSLLRVTLDGPELHIRPVQVTETAPRSRWARELYDLFAPARREARRRREGAIDSDIDRAIAAVRRDRGSRRT